jgi:predicted nucleotide-binding protein
MKIFVASSVAAKPQAKAFMKGCVRPGLDFLPWWEQFTAGQTLLDELNRIRGGVERAIFLFSPEYETTIHGRKQYIPNLNVLFEFGFFYSALGAVNVAVIRYGQVYLPSDLGGYIHINGSKRFSPAKPIKIGKQTKTAFEYWLGAQQRAVDEIFAQNLIGRPTKPRKI